MGQLLLPHQHIEDLLELLLKEVESEDAGRIHETISHGIERRKLTRKHFNEINRQLHLWQIERVRESNPDVASLLAESARAKQASADLKHESQWKVTETKSILGAAGGKVVVMPRASQMPAVLSEIADLIEEKSKKNDSKKA